MAEKLSSIDQALANLERQYIEHKEKFEKWKVDNKKQSGTATYSKYVDQFNRWEAGVKEQQKQLLEERNNVSFPRDVGSTIDSMLSKMSLKDFILAVVIMTSKDSSFFPLLLSKFKKAPSLSNAVNHITPVIASHSERIKSSQESTVSKKPYDRAPSKSLNNTPAKTVESLHTDAPLRKPYRALSPVSDYRNPSTLPFRDFSQA